MTLKKIIAFITSAAISVALVSVPVLADGGMAVYTPKYYRVVDANTEVEVDAPVNGAFESAGTYKSEVEIVNGAGEDAVLIAAVCDASGRLLNVAFDKKAAADASDTLSVSLAVGENQKFKTFIWDTMTDIRPIETQDPPPVIATIRAANTYTDGVELRWTTDNAQNVTGYTVKRNGTTIASNYQMRTYYDKGLSADTQYSYTVTPETAAGAGAESSVCTARTQEDHYASMTLPFGDNYLTNTTATSSSEQETGGDDGTDYTSGGLTFLFGSKPNRYRHHLTKARLRGGKYCRATMCQSRGSTWDTDNYYQYYNGSRYGTQMLFKVDNNIIPAAQRNVIIEFDYFDDNNSNIYGQVGIELKYLKYNNGGSPATGTKSISLTGTNTWKTARIELTDAYFNKTGSSSWTDLSNLRGGYYDFQIGMGGNRGGFASSYVKVYVPGCVPMPEHEISAEVNAAGTAMEGALLPSIWSGSYDRDIGYSGTDSLSAVGGKHYLYNKEYAGYTNSGEGWKRWKNSFYFKVPDEFLLGNDYEKVEVEVEYYVPSDGTVELGARDVSKADKTVSGGAVMPNEWTTKVFTITPNDGNAIVFGNCFDSAADFRIGFNCQGYIHKVTVKKDIFED